MIPLLLSLLLARAELTTHPVPTAAVADSLARYDALFFSSRAPAADRQLIRDRTDAPMLMWMPSMSVDTLYTDPRYFNGRLHAMVTRHDWFLRRTNGGYVVTWPNAVAINLTIPACRDSFAAMIAAEVNATAALWDGLLLDECHDTVRWLAAPGEIAVTDEEWRAGVRELVGALRSRLPNATLAANGALYPASGIPQTLDGIMLEGYGWMPPLYGDWSRWAARYDALRAAMRPDAKIIITSATTATFRKVYSTALVRGCYFASAPWSGVDWHAEYNGGGWYPTQHYVFGLDAGTWCVSQGALALGRQAGTNITFRAPLSSPVSIAACAAGQRPSRVSVE